VARRWARPQFATGALRTAAAGAEGTGLYKARDGAKDQSYFLHAVAGEELARTLMPLGELQKSAVREPRAVPGCRYSTSPTAPASASLASALFARFLARFLAPTPGPSKRRRRAARHP